MGSPADLTLIRMQADNTLPAASRRNYKGVVDAMARPQAAPCWRLCVLPRSVNGNHFIISHLNCHAIIFAQSSGGS